jgi:hypothetical protein
MPALASGRHRSNTPRLTIPAAAFRHKYGPDEIA